MPTRKPRMVYKLAIHLLVMMKGHRHAVPAVVRAIKDELHLRIDALAGPLPADFDPELYYVTKGSPEIEKAYYWAYRVCSRCERENFDDSSVDLLILALINCAEPEFQESRRSAAKRGGQLSGRRRDNNKKALWLDLAKTFRDQGRPVVRDIENYMRVHRPHEKRSAARIRQVLRQGGFSLKSSKKAN